MGGRINWKFCFVRNYSFIPHDLASLINLVPKRNRDAEETLTADEPVTVQPFDPIAVTALHVWRMPSHFVTASYERLVQFGVSSAVFYVPLAASNYFQWAVAFFEKFHGVVNGSWFTNHFLSVLKQLNDLFFCRENRLPCH